MVDLQDLGMNGVQLPDQLEKPHLRLLGGIFSHPGRTASRIPVLRSLPRTPAPESGRLLMDPLRLPGTPG